MLAGSLGLAAAAAGCNAFSGVMQRKANRGNAVGSRASSRAASLIKITVSRLSQDGVAALSTSWTTYGFVLCGAGSVILVQAALHAGTLVAAQPGITLLDPVVAVLWGTLVLNESIRTGPIAALAGPGCALVVGAVFLLARSPGSIGEHRREPQHAESRT
jgi:drug/metabolite transporter (DMT)-like permease